MLSSKGNIEAGMLSKLLLEAIFLAEKASLFVDFVMRLRGTVACGSHSESVVRDRTLNLLLDALKISALHICFAEITFVGSCFKGVQQVMHTYPSTFFSFSAHPSGITCKVAHPVDSSRELHFCSDFPHLLKRIRNTFVSPGFTTRDGRACIERIEAA